MVFDEITYNVFFKNILSVKYIKNINKNIFNNFLITVPTPYFFQILLSLVPILKSENASVL